MAWRRVRAAGCQGAAGIRVSERLGGLGLATDEWGDEGHGSVDEGSRRHHIEFVEVLLVPAVELFVGTLEGVELRGGGRVVEVDDDVRDVDQGIKGSDKEEKQLMECDFVADIR